jgi:hypothetical protein
MIRNPLFVTIIAASIATHSAGALAGSFDMSMACTLRSGDGDVAIAITYIGDETGTLTAKTAIGDMTLAARAEKRDIPAGDGTTEVDTYIRALGPVELTLPALADVETCVKAKISSEFLNDRDMKEVTAADCIQSLPAGAATVKLDAAIEILTDSNASGAFYSLSYQDTSSLGENVVRISSYPLTNCKTAQ